MKNKNRFTNALATILALSLGLNPAAFAAGEFESIKAPEAEITGNLPLAGAESVPADLGLSSLEAAAQNNPINLKDSTLSAQTAAEPAALANPVSVADVLKELKSAPAATATSEGVSQSAAQSRAWHSLPAFAADFAKLRESLGAKLKAASDQQASQELGSAQGEQVAKEMTSPLGSAPETPATTRSAPTATNSTLGTLTPQKPAEAQLNAAPAKPKPFVHLFDSLQPKAYDVHLTVDPNAGEFTGVVTLKADLMRASDHITLHSLDMTFHKVLVNGIAIDPAKILPDPNPENESVIIPLGKKMAKGPVTITMEYTGKIRHTADRQDMHGLYQTVTTDANGAEDKGLVTQHESTYFRYTVPGVDEPQAKARFKVTITAPTGYIVRSNQPEVSRTTKKGLQTVSFKNSPLQSSYLMAVRVGHMRSRSTKLGRTIISVWSAPKDFHLTAFALKEAKDSMKFYTWYYGIAYPLKKLDLIAVSDFEVGAMENWGMVTFRDSAILVDLKHSSVGAIKRVVVVVRHENAHMWNGDLVTMKWWNDTWLNEAFATFMEGKSATISHPELNFPVDIELGDRQAALATDALKSTRPIAVAATSPAEIESMFDVLSYQKGASMLRMLEGYLGEKVFMQGVRLYIKKHKYANAEAKDFWAALEQASGKPVRRMAKDWLTQPGFPLIQAQSLTTDNKTIKLSQGRFFLDGSPADSTRWTVPVVIKYQVRGETKPRTFSTLLKKGEMTVKLPANGPVEWIYPNAGPTGFYRVSLDSKLGKALQAQATTALSVTERLALISDQAALARAGRIPINALLDTLAAFKGDSSRPVLEALASSLQYLSDNFSSGDDQQRLAQFSEDIFSAQWKRLGWGTPKDNDETKLSRAAVVSALANVGRDAEIIAGAQKLLKDYLQNPASVDPVLVPVVLKLGAQNGGADIFEAYHQQLINFKTPEQKSNMLMALGNFKQADLVQRYVDMLVGPEVKSQDAWMGLASMLNNTSVMLDDKGAATTQTVQDRTWELIKAQWPAIKAKIASGGVRYLVSYLRLLSKKGMPEDVTAFFAKPENQVPSAQKALAQSLESMQIDLNYKQAQAQNFSNWLKTRYP